MNQNKEQFEHLYGDNEETRSNVRNAGYYHLFENLSRPAACEKFGVKEQSLHTFLQNNKTKHYDMNRYQELSD